MQNYEYKVVPAPTNGTKAKGVKTVEGRFAVTLETLMNKMGTDGWEFQRAETLPSEERSGLMSKSTTFRNVLVFRRSLAVPETPAEMPVVLPVAEIETEEDVHQSADADMETESPFESHDHSEDTIIDRDTAEYDETHQPLVASRD